MPSRASLRRRRSGPAGTAQRRGRRQGTGRACPVGDSIWAAGKAADGIGPNSATIVSAPTGNEPRKIRSARLRGTAGGGDAPGRLVSRFVGRESQLAQFIGAVSEDPRSAARIVAVTGAPGCGKSRFVEEVLGRLVRSGRPVSVVQPDLLPGMDEAAWLRAFAAKLPIGGGLVGGAAARLAGGGPGNRLDDSSARALLNALFHEFYDCGMEKRGFVRPKFQMVALVLDDFDVLPAGIARWLADVFLPRIDEVRAHLDYVLILVGERALATELEPVAWNAQPMRFFSVEIPPMSEAESVELLALYARRSAEAKACHAIGEGLPGSMLELLRHRIRPMDELTAAVDRCDEAQAAAMLAVAGLGFATEEGVRLVLGPEGLGRVAGLLSATVTVPIFGSLQRGGLWLPGAIARLVQEKLVPRHPEVARRAHEMGDLLDALAGYFPSEEEREDAARLVAFRYFDGAVLRACYGAEAGAELERFVRAHGAAFASTPADNFQLAEELRPLLERYAEARGDPARSALREKVARLWAERAGELQIALRSAADGLARLERDRDELFKELETARGQVSARVQDTHREWRSRIDEDVVRLGASLLANGVGVVCFWVALFTDNQRLTFLLLGAILIGVGIGTPAMKRGRRPAATDPANAARRQHQDRVEHARGVVNLLEARAAALQQRLVEERRKVERLRGATEEPYCD